MRLGREIHPGHLRPAAGPRQGVHAEVALQVQQALALHVAHLLKFQRLQLLRPALNLSRSYIFEPALIPVHSSHTARLALR